MQHLVHNTIQYNVALPKGFDPSEKYPLVIYVHGVDDPVVSVAESISMANALRTCGGDVKLTLLPEVGHNA